MLSIIIPSYNEEKMIEKTAETVSSIMDAKKIEYELIFVDDGSRDSTWDKIKKVSNKKIIGLRFSKNFGKDAAVLAGLKKASGDCAVILDCDLQFPPEKIFEMYKLWLEGYDIVEGTKKQRGKENPVYSFFAKTFYKIMSGSCHIDLSNDCDFKMIDRKVIDTICDFPEKDFFFRGIISKIGFRRAKVKFTVAERTEGDSKWSVKKLIKYAITNICSYTNLPLLLPIITTALFILASVMNLIIYACNKNNIVLIAGIITLCSGIIMGNISVIGYYIWKIHEASKQRPRYILAETTAEA